VAKVKKVLMGNEAIAWALLAQGATVLTSYPGTPASEILASARKFKAEKGLEVWAEWAVNEKVAFEIALTNSWIGGRSAVMMKQVGLNVALDPLMSAAYAGVKGGFVVVSADDPGPYSSQTEQDSRFLAMFAKIPVLDPATPQEAAEMVRRAFELSERHQIPVMLRPTSWICHGRQGFELEEIVQRRQPISLQKDPAHWAAPPRQRFRLHGELNRKVKEVARANTVELLLGDEGADLAVIASGVPFAHLHDVIKGMGIEDRVAVYKVDMPFPLPPGIESSLEGYAEVLVLEEPGAVVELQLRMPVRGRLDGTLPSEGEYTPELVADVLLRLLGSQRERPSRPKEGHRPRLCPGCPHRAAFWALKEALPGGIYPGDIGCYTLGMNLGVVDSFLCMGASVSQAEGFWIALRQAGLPIPPIGATIGDSTFLHAGVPALMDAVHNRASFVLMILDNGTTAMTGRQPTLATGEEGKRPVSIEEVVRGCGVEFIRVVDPYDVETTIQALKEADRFARGEGKGPAVVIARRPCPLLFREESRGVVRINDNCTGCMTCVHDLECPALEEGDGIPVVLEDLCRGCGVCVHVCPVGAIEVVQR